MCILANQHITQPRPDSGDGITVFGWDGHVTIRDCVVDFGAWPIRKVDGNCVQWRADSRDERGRNLLPAAGVRGEAGIDEALSGVAGARAMVMRCHLRGAGKLVLWGNGDHPAEDNNAALYMESCVLSNFGRRGPEAQDGARVTLVGCIIRNWGVKNRFDVRAFGAWAHHGAHIEAVDCVFEQTSFWQTGVWNFFRDLANHVGQAVNDRGLLGLRWKDFIPGVCRGLTASDGGTVKAVNCRRNKWWIRLEGQASAS